MHFSKTYAQILEDLPVELQQNAIQYRQLKKLINQIVLELSSLGLSPTILQDIIVSEPAQAPGQSGSASLAEVPSAGHPIPSGDQPEHDSGAIASKPLTLRLEDLGSLKAVIHNARVKYEVIGTSDRIEPHLRLWVTVPEHELPAPSSPDLPTVEDAEDEASSEGGNASRTSLTEVEDEDKADDASFDDADSEEAEDAPPDVNVLSTLRSKLDTAPRLNLPRPDSPPAEEELPSPGPGAAFTHIPGRTHEVIVPLVSDTKFFNNLSSALESMSAHLSAVHHDFQKSLEKLSRKIAATALPASASPVFRAHSALTSHAGSVQVSTYQPTKSDLYSWREIFQLYVDTEVFEHIGEVKRGERSIEESERRLKLFVDQATKRGLADRRNFKMKQSREALDAFIEMNLFILNIKKFSEASSEATRKILKKHTKRTSLPLPFAPSTALARSAGGFPLSTAPLQRFARLGKTSFPRILVQAVGQTLLPIIPHIDDYACLICTAIAFKPIRLSCGHLFCVRCLVKMQKSGKGRCPCCRRNSVAEANGSNVDWALLNFMQDWFPIESREKLKANEKEVADEQLRELGIDPDRGCVLM